MACSRCGASRRQTQIPSGVRAGTKPVVQTPAGRSAPAKGIRETITGLRYVPSGK